MRLWYYWILELLFPSRCMLCRRLLSREETDLCSDCRKNAPVFPRLEKNCHPFGKTKLQFLDSFTAVWYYEGNVRNSILRYKFHRARQLAGGYGRLLAMKLQNEYPEGFDYLTWVPVSDRRKRQRGYDQSELLAQSVGRELGMAPVRLLKKIRDNPPQSGTEAENRKANVLGVYRYSGTESIRGKRILLLDDVFTTGATAEECARVLLTAGAQRVSCGTIAAARHRKTQKN